METDTTTEKIDRRQFIIRAAKAGAFAGAACAAGFGFHTTEVRQRSEESFESFQLPDFSAPGLAPRISIAKGSDRKACFEKAMRGFGGMSSVINKGDRVLLKVNAAFASPPILSATTHPDLVETVTRSCYHAGASLVIVSDNPINDPASCFLLTGIEEGAKKAGAKVMVPRKEWFRSCTVPGGKYIKDWPVLHEPIEIVNKIIGIAPVKDHHRSGASMTMKNWYGLLGGRRNVFHQDIHTIITELAVMVRPSLVVLDGITSMMHNGPTGGSLSDLKQTNTLIVGNDQVAVDAFGAELLGRSVSELPFIAKAESAGVGTSDWRSLKPVFS